MLELITLLLALTPVFLLFGGILWWKNKARQKRYQSLSVKEKAADDLKGHNQFFYLIPLVSMAIMAQMKLDLITAAIILLPITVLSSWLASVTKPKNK